MTVNAREARFHGWAKAGGPSDGVRGALTRPCASRALEDLARKAEAERFVATIETDEARGQYIDLHLGGFPSVNSGGNGLRQRIISRQDTLCYEVGLRLLIEIRVGLRPGIDFTGR